MDEMRLQIIELLNQCGDAGLLDLLLKLLQKNIK